MSASQFNSSPADLLTYRDQRNGNTRLHETISKGDSATALEIIRQDAAQFKLTKKTIVNLKGWGNPALVLAIESGMQDVALALINHPGIDVDLPSNSNHKFTEDGGPKIKSRGLRPIDIACILKHNVIIFALIKKVANLKVNPWLLEDLTKVLEMKPEEAANALQLANLYQFNDSNAGKEIFHNYARVKPLREDYFFTHHTSDIPPGIGLDDTRNAIYYLLSDCAIWHLEKLCANRGWGQISGYDNLNQSNRIRQYILEHGTDMFWHGLASVALDKELLNIFKRKEGKALSNLVVATPEDSKTLGASVSLKGHFGKSAESSQSKVDNSWYDFNALLSVLDNRLRARIDAHQVFVFSGLEPHNVMENLHDRIGNIQNDAKEHEGAIVPTKIAIPLNLNQNHWTALYINFDRGFGYPPTVTYVDPLHANALPPQVVLDGLQRLYGVQAQNITSSNIQYQTDGYNCGPWTGAILESLALTNRLPAANFDINARREDDRRFVNQPQHPHIKLKK